MLSIVSEIAQQLALRPSGGRFSGRCPKCGGGDRSARFVLFQDGGYKCFSCDFSGSLVSLLRDVRGLSCPDAHEAAGEIPCSWMDCPARTGCRLGDDTRQRPRRRLCSPSVPERSRDHVVAAASARSPASHLWRVWADDLARRAAARMQLMPEQVQWLASRGIPADDAVPRYGLGWLEHDHRVRRENIGLAAREDKPFLWVPSGLLIPIYDADGILMRLRVRRTPQCRERFLPDLKYVWIEGSGTGPLVLHPAGELSRGVVLVESELDAMACASAHHEVIAVALGTVSAGITPDLDAVLRSAPVVLVALDADQPSSAGRPGPGQAATEKWLASYRQAKRYQVPMGKDPGEMAQQGGDLTGWLEDGLAPRRVRSLRVQEPKKPGSVIESVVVHESPASPGICQEGVRGDGTGSLAIELRLHNGSVVYLTDDRTEWRRLVDAGFVVFSRNELERLRAAGRACADSGRPDGAAVLLDAVLLVKEELAGSYVRGGGAAVPLPAAE